MTLSHWTQRGIERLTGLVSIKGKTDFRASIDGGRYSLSEHLGQLLDVEMGGMDKSDAEDDDFDEPAGDGY